MNQTRYLILIRHSVSRPDPQRPAHEWRLTDEGRARCVQLADELRPYGVQWIYTSEEPKAQRTGELVAAQLGIPCRTAPNLHETRRVSAPFFADIREFHARIRAAMEQPDAVVFGEEAFGAARERFRAQIESLLAAHPGASVALVSHGSVLAMALAQMTGRDPFALWCSLEMPAYAAFTLPEKRLHLFKPRLG